ncbi:MAG: hypothetical protein WBV73_31240 [Phormidium sp.]
MFGASGKIYYDEPDLFGGYIFFVLAKVPRIEFLNKLDQQYFDGFVICTSPKTEHL